MQQSLPAESRDSLELRAYALWEERGRPWGTPEVDWFRAESELSESEPVTTKAAKIVGAVLGSVTGIVAAVGSSLSTE